LFGVLTMELLLVALVAFGIGAVFGAWAATSSKDVEEGMPETRSTKGIIFPTVSLDAPNPFLERLKHNNEGVYLEPIGSDASNPFGTKAQPGVE